MTGCALRRQSRQGYARECTHLRCERRLPLTADKSISTTTRLLLVIPDLQLARPSLPTGGPFYAAARSGQPRGFAAVADRELQGASYEMLSNYFRCCFQRRTGGGQRLA